MNPMKQRDVLVDWFDKVKIRLHTPYDVVDHLINYLDQHGWTIVHKETDGVLDPEEMKQCEAERGITR